MENEFGFKDLYEVSIKTTYPIEMGQRTIEEGETIAFFDRIQFSNFGETKVIKKATGGYDNRSWVWWEETKEIPFTLQQGVFSKQQLSLLMNAKLISADASPLSFPTREKIETNEDGFAQTKHAIDSSKKMFVYDAQTGEKITNFSFGEQKVVTGVPFQELVVDYYFMYDKTTQTLTFGNGVTNGFLALTGKTRVKDDITGQVKTGIITIPKFKLVSNLSMSLGSGAYPITGSLNGVAIPVGPKGQKRVMDLVLLDDDIDSDM